MRQKILRRAVVPGGVAIAAVMVLLSCAETPTQRPTTVVSRPQASFTSNPRLGHPTVASAYALRVGMPLPQEVTWDAFGGPPIAEPDLGAPAVALPDPIPGRLLAKIAPSHVAESFLPRPQNCDIAELQQMQLLPGQLPISAVRFAGITQAGDTAIRIDLKRPLDAESLRAAFSQTRAAVAADTLDRIRDKETNHVVAVYDAVKIGGQAARPCEPDYFHIKQGSRLHTLFRKAGVQSMRRVFRSVEVPDRARPGWFRVRPVEEMMESARRDNPDRAARGDPNAVLPGNMANWFVLTIAADVDLDDALRILQATEIESVSMDFPYRTAAPEDQPFWPSQWGLENSGCMPAALEPPEPCTGLTGFDISAVEAWSESSLENPVVVAVLDTGFNEILDELAPRLWTNDGETPGNGLDDDCSGYVDDVHGIHVYNPDGRFHEPDCVPDPGGPAVLPGEVPINTHGTRVASVLAADASSTDPSDMSNGISGAAGLANVQLMNINIGRCASETTWGTGTAEVAEGLFYTIFMNAEVINMSIQTTAAPALLHDVVMAARAGGLVMVAAAGNDNRAFGPGPFTSVVPAGMNGVIAVGGATRRGLRYASSNYGAGLDLVAPAVNVLAITYDPTAPPEPEGVADTSTGTSFAVPHVSATAALVLSRHPRLRAPFMRQWLKASADDLVDPNGTGDTLPGEDIWTGAGMLNAGRAASVSSLGDGPIDVEVRLERAPTLHHRLRGPYKNNAVAGMVDIGLRVQPFDLSVLDRWELHYAPGTGLDATDWTEIPVTDVSARDPIGGSEALPALGDMPSDVQLNSDLLENNQLYVVRLTAWNANTGPEGPRSFTSYDVIRPVRSAVVLPAQGTTIVGRWGWPQVYGSADIRSGAQYVFTLRSAAGGMLWGEAYRIDNYVSGMTNPPAPIIEPRWTDPTWDGRPYDYSSFYYELLRGMAIKRSDPAHYMSEEPPDSLSEGWYSLTLSVGSPVETPDESLDTAVYYLDNSHFAYKVPPSYFDTGPQPAFPTSAPVQTTDQYHSPRPDVLVIDMGGGIGRRMFLHANQRFYCLEANGDRLLDSDGLPIPPLEIAHDKRDYNEIRTAMAFDDVDGDGIKEIAVISGYPWEIHLIRHDCLRGYSSQTHAGHHPDWPAQYRFMRWPFIEAIRGTQRIRLADVTGDDGAEIIAYVPGNDYVGAEADGNYRPGRLIVLDKDRSSIAELEVGAREPHLLTGNFDAEPKAEIFFQGRPLEADLTPMSPTWPTIDLRFVPELHNVVPEPVSEPQRMEVVTYRSTSCGTERCAELGVDNYHVQVHGADGTVLGGWPRRWASEEATDAERLVSPAKVFATAADVVAGGNLEIVTCADAVRVYDSANVRLSAFPEINLDGNCRRIGFLDIDNDGDSEFIVTVDRYRADVPSLRRGRFVEAYDPATGNRHDAGGRWPIVVAGLYMDTFGGGGLLGQVKFVDTDGDGFVEAVQPMRFMPYGQHVYPDMLNDMTRLEILDLTP